MISFNTTFLFNRIDDLLFMGNNSFMPSNPYDRALGIFWADFIDTKVT